MKTFRLFIGGDWCDPAGGKWFDSIEPYTGRPWARIPHGGPEDVEAAVAAARHAFEQGDWARTNATTRGRLLRRLGDLLRDQGEEIARIEARDNGKRLAEALPQFRYLPEWLYYYGGLADKVEGAVIPLDIPDVFNFTRYEPLGVVAAITPWNSPVMLMLWKLAPALAAGNTLVVKPSEHASASTLAFMELVQQAGFPPGVVNVVTGFADGAGEPLVSHPDVAKVTFTGSVNGGRAVNRTAADQLKPVTLELGGKSPQIVFADANLDNAVNGVLSGLFLSNGQTCVAGSRILVQEEIAPEFEQRLVGALADLRMGDPSDPATRIGPIANEMQFDTILGFLDS
ncbi:MAG: aldehyde dehydrogenase family protein, partial [Gammaproteobacteria bacterium]|nr:aldehyde dehydrogenase family protein [Gammaproteobacteria bacterium]